MLESLGECHNILISNVEEVEPVNDVIQISRVTSKFIGLDSKKWAMKIDLSGSKQNLSKHERKDTLSSVNENGELLIVRQPNKVMRVRLNKTELKEVLSVDCNSIKSVFFSRFSREILVIIVCSQQLGKKSTRIERYKKNGERLSGFEYHSHDILSVDSLFLSENINGDIWVSDNIDCQVCAYDNEGKQLHSYNGFDEGSPQKFSPTGICNDILGHVLVCNCHESDASVHVLDKKGTLLAIYLRGRNCVKEPWGLCVNDEEGKLYLGQKNCGVIKVFRYLEKINTI